MLKDGCGDFAGTRGQVCSRSATCSWVAWRASRSRRERSRAMRLWACWFSQLLSTLEICSMGGPNGLRKAEAAGIWPGVATYLTIVSDHVKQYRGTPLTLPGFVREAARFGGNQIKARARFLRVPVLPHGAALYTHQVTHTAMRGDVPGTLRLGLLPYLASAAAVAYKITGSDKGVW